MKKEIYKINRFSAMLLMAATLPLQAELVTEYFDWGTVKSQINYLDTNKKTKTGERIKEGEEKVYYETGELAYTVTNHNNLRDGKMTWYDKQGKVIEIMYYQMGKRHGQNILYYSNGNKRIETTYINDKKEGPYREYFDNGKLGLEVNYKNGYKEGIQKEYHENGKLASEVLYKKGYKEGIQKWYDKEGRLIRTQEFKMDRPVDVLKKLRSKKPDATNELLKGLDFDPNKRKID
jgi:antitoxin component YwqK of YwqJK toxin-antitoxin module